MPLDRAELIVEMCRQHALMWPGAKRVGITPREWDRAFVRNRRILARMAAEELRHRKPVGTTT